MLPVCVAEPVGVALGLGGHAYEMGMARKKANQYAERVIQPHAIERMATE
jgi:hypothetical protein